MFSEDRATDQRLLSQLCHGIIGIGTFAFVVLHFVRAPYGRYSQDSSKLFGFLVPARVQWVIMECPVLVMGVLCCLTADKEILMQPPNLILISLLLLHYFNRTFIYPFRLRNPKPGRLVTFLLAFSFCVANGYLQMRHLTRYAVFPPGWALHPRFLLGLTLWALGFGINLWADSTLIGLRKEGETGYKVPRSGLFEYVSCPNYLGEILEWTGFALAQNWHPAPLAFAYFSFCNLAPRARQHHQWYKEKMRDLYPANRKALIPFLF